MYQTHLFFIWGSTWKLYCAPQQCCAGHISLRNKPLELCICAFYTTQLLFQTTSVDLSPTYHFPNISYNPHQWTENKSYDAYNDVCSEILLVPSSTAFSCNGQSLQSFCQALISHILYIIFFNLLLCQSSLSWVIVYDRGPICLERSRLGRLPNTICSSRCF